MVHVDYSELKLSDLLMKENDKISYEYDFGDGCSTILSWRKSLIRIQVYFILNVWPVKEIVLRKIAVDPVAILIF